MCEKPINLTAVLHKTQDMRYEERRIPKPKDEEVLLRVDCVGICGSDVHYWWEGRSGRFIVQSPLVLGHESSGTVVECGRNVCYLVPGDRVAIEPGIPCRKCKHCKGGRYNVCPDVQFCATPPIDGTLTQFYTHPADFCFKLPSNVSSEEGAMLEPLSVAVYSCRRAEVGLGSRVLILGAGPIGLLCLQTAVALGASCICITDINEKRLQFALHQGANSAINVAVKNPKEAAVEVIRAMRSPPTAIIECSGAESSYQLGILAGAPRSIMVTVGRGQTEVTLPMTEISIKEMDIKGIFRYANCYETALAMVSSSNVNLGPLITHRYPFEKVKEAFHTAKDGHAIKVMIKMHSTG